jgi:NADH-quinone oxidoreductase subunit H
MVFIGTFIPFVVLPFSKDVYGASMDLGIFFISSFMALEVIGVIMAGWASNSKWSLYGAMRLASQMMSYEIPLGLSLATVAVYAGSLNVHEIVEQQGAIPNIFRSPFLFISFIIFYVAALASAKRAPFDLPEAESELVAGFHTEYSGMRFSFFFLAEYAAMYVLAALGALLYLGGWYGPIPIFWIDLLFNTEMLGGLVGPGNFLNEALKNIIGLHNLLIKAAILLFLMIQIRWTLPRMRIDQVMTMCWKVLLPFSLICLMGAAFQGIFEAAYLH